MALSRLLSLAWLALAVGAVAGAAAPPGPLGDLAAPRHGRPRHDGTWDRRGGNVDFRGLQAGQSLTLFETRGAGIVRRFWMTFFPRAPALHRQLVLRMYWDGEATPSVEVPVGAAMFPGEIFRPSRRWAERSYNIVHWSEPPRGGHFAACEVPDLFVEEVRSFFRRVR